MKTPFFLLPFFLLFFSFGNFSSNPKTDASKPMVKTSGNDLSNIVLPANWGPKAGKYFLEIHMVTDSHEENIINSSAFVPEQDTVRIWFKSGPQGQVRQDLEALFTQVTDQISDGQFATKFLPDTPAPPDLNKVITIHLANTNFSGQAFPLPQESNSNNGGGVTVTGGLVKLPYQYYTDGHASNTDLQLAMHELTHIFACNPAHSGFLDAVLGGGQLNTVGPPAFPAYELAGLQMMNRLPVGTTFTDLFTQGIITMDMIGYKPSLALTEQPIGGLPGNDIIITGDHLRYEYGGNRDPTLSTTFNFLEPTVSVTGQSTPVQAKAPTTHSSMTNKAVEFKLPAGIQSGPIHLNAYGQSTQPVHFSRFNFSNRVYCMTNNYAYGIADARDYRIRHYDARLFDGYHFEFDVSADNQGDVDCFCFSRPWNPYVDGDWYSSYNHPDLITYGVNYGPDHCEATVMNVDGIWCYLVLYSGADCCISVTNESHWGVL